MVHQGVPEVGRLESLRVPALRGRGAEAGRVPGVGQGALLAVDNTFATPVNQQPLSLGADLVVHSATKYLGGHSDVTAGTLMGPKVLLDPVNQWRKSLGQMLAPETAALLLRSLRTLVVRVQRQNASAAALAPPEVSSLSSSPVTVYGATWCSADASRVEECLALVVAVRQRKAEGFPALQEERTLLW